MASAARNPVRPAEPTFREQGMPEFEFTAWVSVFAPAGVPAPVLERLNAVVRKAVDSPEMAQTLAKTGGTAMHFDQQETQAFYGREVARWARYIKDSGVKPEQ